MLIINCESKKLEYYIINYIIIILIINYISKNERKKLNVCYKKIKKKIFTRSIYFLFVTILVTFLPNIRIYKYFALTNTRVRASGAY